MIMAIYPLIYQNYWKFSCWRHNNKAPYYLKQFRKSQFWLKEDIEKLQLKKIKVLVGHAYKTVPYYKKIMKENNLHPSDIVDFRDLEQFPILTKSKIQENLDDLVSVNVEKEKLRRDYTGGSTGEPLIFYKDKNYLEPALADRYRSCEFAGYKLGYKMVRLWGANRDEPHDTLRIKLQQKISRTIFINTYNICEKDMNQIMRKLKMFKPDFIIGYASSLYFFAQFLEKNNIDGIAPKSILSSAEVLHDYQRNLISRVFLAPVFNRYGCREIGTIACECEQHNGLHVFAENQYVEITDETAEGCNSEEIGKVIVTNLNNYSFPFIRYEIGDMARKSDIEKCNCGRGLPLLEEISGRTIDNFIFPGGNIVHGHYFIFLFYGIKGVKKFQVIQEEIDKLKIKIVKSSELNENEINRIIKTIKKDCGTNIEIRLNYVKEIDETLSGKQIFTISKIIDDYYRQQ